MMAMFWTLVWENTDTSIVRGGIRRDHGKSIDDKWDGTAKLSLMSIGAWHDIVEAAKDESAKAQVIVEKHEFKPSETQSKNEFTHRTSFSVGQWSRHNLGFLCCNFMVSSNFGSVQSAQAGIWTYEGRWIRRFGCLNHDCGEFVKYDIKFRIYAKYRVILGWCRIFVDHMV